MPEVLTLDLSRLPAWRRARVARVYADAQARAIEDAELAAAYDEAVKQHGYPCALDEVAEEFSRRWDRRVTPSRVRVARWGQ